MPAAFRDLDEGGDGSPQVEQGVQFDGCLAAAEQRPREKAQAQVDGGGVQGVHRLFQLQAQVLAGIQPSRRADELLGQIGVDAPVPPFVGLGQGAAGDLASEAYVVKLRLAGTQAGFDVPQAPTVGELAESHGQELVPADPSPEKTRCSLGTWLKGSTRNEPSKGHLREFKSLTTIFTCKPL